MGSLNQSLSPHLWLWTAFTSLLIIQVSTSPASPHYDCPEKIFESAKESYYEDDWSGCVSQIQASLHAYSLYTDTLIECRRRCGRPQTEERLAVNSDPTLRSYSASLLQITCLRRCYQSSRRYSDPSLCWVEEFQSREPFDFLQMCYYKVDQAYDQYVSPLSASLRSAVGPFSLSPISILNIVGYIPTFR